MTELADGAIDAEATVESSDADDAKRASEGDARGRGVRRGADDGEDRKPTAARANPEVARVV